MITSSAWRGKRYFVLGLARSGRACVDALLASGAQVAAWDEQATARATVPGAVPLIDPLATDLAVYAGIIVSPGVPLNRHPIAARAAEATVPIIGDIELFAQARAELAPHKVVGITGTNGKSTTTALVHHMCATAGLPTLMGGNIGLPILAQLPLPDGGVYVLELSSYQIDLTQSLDCDVAVLLNITPDHLDRYTDFEAYAAAKGRLFAMQSPDHAAIICINDLPSYHIAQAARAQVDRIAAGGCMDQSRWPALQGPHNAQNALAAIAAAQKLGIAEPLIDQALASFTGLAHRMERVRVRDGVTYINDSKATNPAAAAPALAALTDIHWILGGEAKSAELDACLPHLSRVRAAYTIGAAGPMLGALLSGKVEVHACDTLDAAVRAASGAARNGDTVLLSPACASFDQFRDFEARGAAFRALVEGL